jgi:hypothetical protein
MPKISEDIIRTVIEHAKIEEVVGDFVDLRKAGVNLTGKCPFHDDKHDGNFIVRPSTLSYDRPGRNSYKCFVCGAKGGPVQFLMQSEKMTFPDAIRYLGKKYCIDVDNVPLNWTPPPPKPVPPPPPPLEIPRSYVSRTIEIETERTVIFTYWLRGLPWDDEQLERLQQTLWMYCVGGWKDGRVVFWQIDHLGIPRAAKLMKYLADGHRDKTQHPGWIYNQDGVRQRLDPEHHTILKPLFGSHLLNRYPQAVINIVESEKTAIIMANYYGDFDSQIWLACGGLKHLQLDSLQPLIDQGRTIWLWPDKDGRDEWQTVCDKLGYDHCRVYTHFFDTCWTEADGDKADIADIAIRMMRTGEGPRKDTGKGQGATEQSATASDQSGANPALDSDHLAIMKQIGEYVLVHPDGEPFLPEDEMADPRLRWMRDTLRHHKTNKHLYGNQEK